MPRDPRRSPDPERDPLLLALRGHRGARTPVWFMRQAGRSLPEYRALRAGVPMLDACQDPQMVCEITLQPVRRYGVDAAILFSDIVVPLVAAGVDLDIVPGRGPVLARPVRTSRDVEAIGAIEPGRLDFLGEAVRMTTERLGSTPLIGFAGAPFTLASYLVEGGPSRNHEHTKALMHGDPGLWRELMERLVRLDIAFLRAQIRAGASAVQLFDSWAGALSAADYRSFVAPHTTRLFDAVRDEGVPAVHFGVGTGELLPDMAATGPDAMGIDFRVPLDEAGRRLPGLPLQGNLDPALLFAPVPVIDAAVRRVVREAAGLPGHVFNLGHGVLPTTDPDRLARVTDLVHELTAS